MSRPDIVLYTANTMNGWKPLIFLHEAEVDYDLVGIDFSKKEQHAPDYLKLNPNGKIPTIFDRAEDRAIFESGAILWHLAEKYGRFLSRDPVERSETLQWLFFQVGHVGPMMGQAMFFQRIAKPNGDEVPYAIDRYVKESRRLMEVLERRLEGRDWLVGGDMSIADMATYPWARSHFWATVDVEGLPNLQAWFDRLDSRPKTQAALQLPEPRPSAFGQGDVEAAASANAARFKE
ncbi:glutathione S-transferase family protein [Roseivivax sp. THAF197b]|uniref:glutathione S-transferase family protein n=1 Tax=Roseivivax sp. THAF197b TaxID=2588299 RepID=UPI001267C1E1|nr:glutathione binding-like protein [Roseivivax sp. THAF197b]QFS81231.1 Disulfide-bond oxidoreductase YfcG [Roseivivax sp. THAF197b]